MEAVYRWYEGVLGQCEVLLEVVECEQVRWWCVGDCNVCVMECVVFLRNS